MPIRVCSMFAEGLPGLALSLATEIDTIAEILAMMGLGTGRENFRRRFARPGITMSGDAVPRHLKRRPRRSHHGGAPSVVRARAQFATELAQERERDTFDYTSPGRAPTSVLH